MPAKESSLTAAITCACTFVAVLWLIHGLQVATHNNFHYWGIYPLQWSGLKGIITAPLIHASWQHLSSNTLPLLLLGSMAVYGYPRSRVWALLCIWLVSGIGVWLFARDSFHFGASGLTHGLFFYLLINGLLRRDKRSMALLMIAFFMYGGMLITILPSEPGISYESHFFGAVGGVLAALALRHRDPLPARKRYSWENESATDSEEDDIIGDEWKLDSPPEAPRSPERPF